MFLPFPRPSRAAALTWSSEALSRWPLRLGFQDSPYPSFWCPRRRRSGLHSPEGSGTRQGEDCSAWNRSQHILEYLALSLFNFALSQQAPPCFGLSCSGREEQQLKKLLNTQKYKWDICLPLIISNVTFKVRKALLSLPTSGKRSYFKQSRWVHG